MLQSRDSVSTYKIFPAMKEVRTHAYVNESPKMSIYTSEDKSSYMFSFAAAWGKRGAYFVPNKRHLVVFITHIPYPDC